jgi:hypothetical protein
MTVPQVRIIADIVAIVMFAVGLVGLRKWNLLNRTLRLLDVYILFCIVMFIIEGVMAYYNIRNLWINNLVRVVELCFYLYIYFLLRPNKRFAQLLCSAFLIYLIIWITGKFTFEPLYDMDVYSGGVAQVIQIGFGGWLLFAISKESDLEWNRDYRFLVVSGIIIYAAATFFMYISFNLMLTLPRPIMRLIWMLNFFFVVIQYIFFLRGFLCKTDIPSNGFRK